MFLIRLCHFNTANKGNRVKQSLGKTKAILTLIFPKQLFLK